MENKDFCIRPFNSLNLKTDGSMSVCCEIVPSKTEYVGKKEFNLKKNSIEEFWKSDYRKYLIKNFQEKRRPKECQKCWEKEDIGAKSQRQFSNRQYKILGNKTSEEYLNLLGIKDLEHPVDYNLDITNLCNLKCYMCTGASSSKLLVENNYLGYENLDQKDYDYEEDKLSYLVDQIEKNHVTHVTLQGGEPLMNPKIISLLEKLSVKKTAEKLSIWITTNGTMYNKKLFETLNAFQDLKIIFSIDGVDKVNDYLRFPSDFSQIRSNVINYLNLKNATFMITNVVQNFNLLYVNDIIEFANTYNIHLHLHILTGPPVLHYSVLPYSTRRKALEKLQNIDQQKVTHVTNFYTLLENLSADIDKDTSNEIERFKDIITKRDSYRKVSLSNFIPELATDLNI
jgi:sulfatase maturation enzyme AslB (radical SAM superfamily)